MLSVIQLLLQLLEKWFSSKDDQWKLIVLMKFFDKFSSSSSEDQFRNLLLSCLFYLNPEEFIIVDTEETAKGLNVILMHLPTKFKFSIDKKNWEELIYQFVENTFSE